MAYVANLCLYSHNQSRRHRVTISYKLDVPDNLCQIGSLRPHPIYQAVLAKFARFTVQYKPRYQMAYVANLCLYSHKQSRRHRVTISYKLGVPDNLCQIGSLRPHPIYQTVLAKFARFTLQYKARYKWPISPTCVYMFTCNQEDIMWQFAVCQT
jgi:hypothetical protein